MRNPYRDLTNTQLALKWWAFKRSPRKERKKAYLTMMQREALLDLVIERLAAAQHSIDRHRSDVLNQQFDFISDMKDALSEYEDWLKERQG